MDASRWEEYHKWAAKAPFKQSSGRVDTYQKEMEQIIETKIQFQRMKKAAGLPAFKEPRNKNLVEEDSRTNVNRVESTSAIFTQQSKWSNRQVRLSSVIDGKTNTIQTYCGMENDILAKFVEALKRKFISQTAMLYFSHKITLRNGYMTDDCTIRADPNFHQASEKANPWFDTVCFTVLTKAHEARKGKYTNCFARVLALFSRHSKGFCFVNW